MRGRVSDPGFEIAGKRRVQQRTRFRTRLIVQTLSVHNLCHPPTTCAHRSIVTPVSVIMSEATQAKLSLAAQFDDMCRFTNSLVAYSGMEEDFIRLLRSHEEFRLKWITSASELNKYHSRVRELESNGRVLETKLKNVRYALEKEADMRAKLQKERDTYAHKLKQLRQFLIDDHPELNGLPALTGSKRDRVISALTDLPVMETLHEVESTEHSLSDLEFDKTEDDVLGQSRRSSRRRSHNKSNNRKSGSRREDASPAKNVSKRSRGADEFPTFDADIDVEMGEMDAVIGVEEKRAPRALFRCETTANVKALSVQATPTASTPELGKRIGAISASLLKPTGSPQDANRMTGENKGHSFVSKKVFRPGEKCGPCEGAIRFCNTCYRCSNCMVTCHPECKDKVPVPCIPFVSRSRNGRQTLISDFVSNESPKIPALIFHCCNEIEKRGLDETGLYRVPGSDKEVKELKEKILKSKNGMPSLASYDVHVICSVVKDFLRSVDEPLVSRILWRDFVRASELQDPEDRMTNLYQAVSELPEANRDTLAFMMCHLQRVAEATAVKMPKGSLAKVFGPAIVGHSMSSPPPVEMMAEIKKQISVMTLLLDTGAVYWNSFLCRRSAGENGNRDQSPARMETGRRVSGGRTIGGSVQTNGILTPHKSIYHQTLKKPLILKPLF